MSNLKILLWGVLMLFSCFTSGQSSLQGTLLREQSLNNVPVITLVDKAKESPALDAKTTIELAKIRTQIKKLEKQLSVRADEQKQAQLLDLQQRLNELQEV